MIMETATCLKCGEKVHGQVRNIVLTLYCENCFNGKELAEAIPSKEMYWTWTSAPEAVYKKGVNPNDLAALRFKAIKRHCDGPRPFSRLYLMTEVESLNSLPQERIQAEIQARRIERQEKKETLLSITGLQLQGLSAYTQLLLLGEYLSGACLTQMELRAVVARCHVMPRVRHILHFCKEAHPEAAIEFCLQYPNACPKDFQELREKMQLVFRFQGFRILGMLWYDIRRLAGTSLHDVSEQFKRRDRIACIRSYLEPMVGLVHAENIVKHPACEEHLRWLGPEDDNDRYIVKQLLKFWNDRGSRTEKRDRLTNALVSRGIMLPNDRRMLKLCKDYITGTKFILLDEVVQQAFKSWMYQVQRDFKHGTWRR